MKILITGATGYVGGQLLPKLMAERARSHLHGAGRFTIPPQHGRRCKLSRPMLSIPSPCLLRCRESKSRTT